MLQLNAAGNVLCLSCLSMPAKATPGAGLPRHKILQYYHTHFASTSESHDVPWQCDVMPLLPQAALSHYLSLPSTLISALCALPLLLPAADSEVHLGRPILYKVLFIQRCQRVPALTCADTLPRHHKHL